MTGERKDHYDIKAKFFDFARILQEAGITVSTVEVLDMFESLRHINPYDRSVFKQTLSSTLVKDYTDIPVFETCFEEFFDKKSGTKGFDFDIFIRDALNAESASRNPLIGEDEKEKLFNEIDTIVDSALDENPDKTARDIIKLLLDEPQSSSASGALGQLLFNVRSRYARAPMDAEGGEREEDDQAAFIESLVRERVRRRILEKATGRAIQKREDYLLNRFIYRLTPEEVKEMRELIKRFGQKMKKQDIIAKKKGEARRD